MYEITPNLDPTAKTPLYVQLSDYLKQEIITGKIASTEKLPSKRKLAQHLGISLNTIQAAYDQLVAEGYIESMPRKGLFVTEMEQNTFFKPRTLLIDEKKQEGPADKLKINFNSGHVDLEAFPHTIWRKLSVQSLVQDQNTLYYNHHPQGEPELREAIAQSLYESRGVACTAEQIIIGAGTQSLISLLYLMIGNESPYALEDPGYHRVRKVLYHHGATLVPIPLDEEGIDIEKLAQSKAKTVYVTPSHQFPYGMIMPIKRRTALLKWAEMTEGYIIEDDYDGEYRYKGKPIPSLQGLDRNERVIYLGTFSKALIPSIRISYMVLPPTLLSTYHQHFTLFKQTTSRLHQETLLHFIQEGHWERHLNKMRTLYRKKHDVLLSTIKQWMGERVRVIGDQSGLHIVLEVKNGMKEEELIASARQKGVKIYPLSIYFNNPKATRCSKVLLGFGGLSEKQIKEGIVLLSKAWKL
ncbi:GntR family transcriptional regulator/MocR family aminotransferase [Pullulanibacillus pueri]|uniref:GntR family transcriptional regulator n=1 Tax=Pullulanibacillus pueri TaxID=1437324 RepID=A0A8J2ZW99_9BACL|nr:PLP-dependent aminotransferase family protein [Pullulanibacillus pueri]MBM7680911.1 GntR family transcriptional regulator/MocR family aminotransferase [Pullulanibacillus pueri]GGH81302.1 GntR family transcriptional regulator [Pullulanibacillus pueri]